MPTRKQKRRRQKGRRHEYEYVYVDEEGHEVEVDEPEEPAPAPVAAKSAKASCGTASAYPAVPFLGLFERSRFRDTFERESPDLDRAGLATTLASVFDQVERL